MTRIRVQEGPQWINSGRLCQIKDGKVFFLDNDTHRVVAVRSNKGEYFKVIETALPARDSMTGRFMTRRANKSVDRVKMFESLAARAATRTAIVDQVAKRRGFLGLRTSV